MSAFATVKVSSQPPVIWEDEVFEDDLQSDDGQNTTTFDSGVVATNTAPAASTLKRSSLTPVSFRTKIQIRQRPFVYRLCTVRMTHLEMLQDVSASSGYFTLAVRIRGQRAKHVLRSDPITLPVNKNESQLFNASLDLQFHAEYMHFLKGKPPRLLIMLQKPHRKLRTQYKTLASVQISLEEVLQAPLNDTVVLESEFSRLERLSKNKSESIARIDMQVDSVLINAPSKLYDVPPDEEPYDFDMESDEDDKDATLISVNIKERTGKFISRFKQRWLQRFRRKESQEAAAFNSDTDSDSVAHVLSNLSLNAEYDQPVEAQVNRLFPDPDPSTQVHLPSHVVLVQRSAPKCRRLLEWCGGGEYDTDGKSVLRNVVVVDGVDDTKLAFKSAVAKYKHGLVHNSTLHLSQLSIVVVGGDSCLTHVLQAYMELLSKERRGWEKLRVYVVPLGRHGDNNVAKWLAGVDHEYRALFFSSEWSDAFSSTNRWILAEGEQIENCIARYVNEATEVVKFPIAEALIDLVNNKDADASSNSARSIPFLKSMQISTGDGFSCSPRVYGTSGDAGVSPPPLNLSSPAANDYVHQQHQAPSSPVVLGLQPSQNVTNALPPLSPKSLDVRKKEKKRVTTLQLDFWPLRDDKKAKKQSVKDKFHEVIVKRWLVNSAEPPSQLYLRAVTLKDWDKQKKPESVCVTKFICSTKNYESSFSVLIDGCVWEDVNFVSVSPQWTANARTLPLATFVTESNTI